MSKHLETHKNLKQVNIMSDEQKQKHFTCCTVTIYISQKSSQNAETVCEALRAPF